MAHLSEQSQPLCIRTIPVQSPEHLLTLAATCRDVCLLRLPTCATDADYHAPLDSISQIINSFASRIGTAATLIIIGETYDLVHIQAQIPPTLRYQHWIAIKRLTPRHLEQTHLPYGHFGALIYTRYAASLRHTKTRLQYTYCPACDKTSKDYGGKKHIYHAEGTLLSDVWRDVACDPDGDLQPIIERFADLFGIESYQELIVCDCRPLFLPRIPLPAISVIEREQKVPDKYRNHIIVGDSIKILQDIPEQSIDFAFADPPYNLGKTYIGYSDDLTIQEYFAWCDQWIEEMARVLKPGRTLALLNIPPWAVRHFLYMQTMLTFQNWIAWDALAYPVRLIMPAHYAILCFSKGAARELPGLSGESMYQPLPTMPKVFHALKPLADGYCLRADCVHKRVIMGVNDRTVLTDLWSDIHRLKHNSRRVDHPCQLPPQLMYRLVTIFTKPGEVVLDSFNGSGTTTLAAHQLHRDYIGIDASEQYCALAESRHQEIRQGIDPFRKEERILTSKNSPVRRMAKQAYKIPKKTLQLEVKRVAQQIGRLPSREELIQHGKYAIEYYDQYFVSWGEVCAAARTTGMTETRHQEKSPASMQSEQLRLLEKQAAYKSMPETNEQKSS